MVVRHLALAAVLAGCGSAHPQAGDARPADAAGGQVDAPAGPCMLPALALHVATLAGCDTPGVDDGPRGVARFANPVNVALAASGVAYVADFDSSRLRAVDPDGTTRTILARSDLARPFGLALAADGTLYLETDDDDGGNHSPTTGTIWKVDPATGDAHVIARDIGRPRGLAVLPDGRLAMADYDHDVISVLDPATGTVTPIAGQLDTPGHVNASGTAARFSQPYDLVALGSDLIVTDLGNQVLRRVTLTGEVTDFAGTGAPGRHDDAYAAATFDQPKGASIDASGAIYITEAGNHDVRVLANGTVTTLAGSGEPGWVDGDDAATAQFYGVEGLDVSADGQRVVIADGNNGDGMPYHHVREIH